MKSHFNIFKPVQLLLTAALLTTLYACTVGKVEPPLPDAFASPASHLNKGIHQYNDNNYAEAIKQFEKALLQYRSIDNQTGIAQSCMNLAKSYMAVNNNQTAATYLTKANQIVKQASLTELNEHLHLLNSSLAIKNADYEQALAELDPVLNSSTAVIQLAAYKNRNTIAFARNDSDQGFWLDKYRQLQQKNPVNTSSHLARILRFESELSTDPAAITDLLTQSLAISQELADRTAIAATLTQWSQVNINNQQYDQAEDRALRALFIRHQLGDIKNTLLILHKLQAIYVNTDNNKDLLTRQWINKLSRNELHDWAVLFSDFDSYPRR